MKVGNAANAAVKDGAKTKNKKPRLGLDASFKKSRSGLQVYHEKHGSGKTAKEGSKIKVHYEGWLAEDYTMFDSSREKRRPFELVLGKGQVIQGWEEALKGAKEGDKLQLKIPARLAYGESGFPGAGVPPNADLIFKVEVMRVKDE